MATGGHLLPVVAVVAGDHGELVTPEVLVADPDQTLVLRIAAAGSTRVDAVQRISVLVVAVPVQGRAPARSDDDAPSPLP
jgi:hypothetical protein